LKVKILLNAIVANVCARFVKAEFCRQGNAVWAGHRVEATIATLGEWTRNSQHGVNVATREQKGVLNLNKEEISNPMGK
jgi:hypothetical protein